MANELTNPNDNNGLAALLKRSFPTLAGALTSEDALPYVPPAIAAKALPLVEAECSPATHDELTFALGWLASVTTGDKLRSPETMQVSARALAAAMREYPRAAALEAIKEWPKGEGGKWWPTENELREAADAKAWQSMRLHRHLKAAAAQDGGRAPRTMDPDKEMRAFIDDVTASHGEGFYKSWWSPLTCQYQGKTLWTHPLGVDRLNERCSKVMERFGITAAWDKESRAYFRAQTAHLEPKKPQRANAW